jgi:oligopeptide transport system substrate-binding protein
MRLIYGLALLSFLLLSCGGKVNKPPADIMRINMISAVSSLDPAFAKSQSNVWADQMIYSSLVAINDSLEIVPALAKNWTISTDGLVLTFNLRNDVYFHDNACFARGKGRKMVANDVVYSFERLIDTTLAAPGSWVFEDRLTAVKPFKAVNDSTFQLRLSRPFGPMLGVLTMVYCSVLPHEAIEKYGAAFRTNPVGTGPFQLVRWQESEGIFLTKNPTYWEKDTQGQVLPYLGGVRVSFIPDRKSAYLALLQGKIDLSNGIDAGIANQLVTPSGKLHPRNEGKIKMIAAPYLNTEYIGLLQGNGGHKALQNKLVRQALNYALDRDQMVYTLRNSIGRAAVGGFTPYGLPSFDAAATPGYIFDPQKAAALLSKAGYPRGKGIEPIKLYCAKDYLDLCTYVARQWADIGVPATIELVEPATMRELISNQKAACFRASWIADYPDAESFYTCFYSKNQAPPNYTRFSNDAFDRLYNESLETTEPSKRSDLYQAMDRILIEEAPVIFLFYDITARFTATRVNGVGQGAMGSLGLQYVRIRGIE